MNNEERARQEILLKFIILKQNFPSVFIPDKNHLSQMLSTDLVVLYKQTVKIVLDEEENYEKIGRKTK